MESNERDALFHNQSLQSQGYRLWVISYTYIIVLYVVVFFFFQKKNSGIILCNFIYKKKCCSCLRNTNDSRNLPIIKSGNFLNVDDSKNWTVLFGFSWVLNENNIILILVICQQVHHNNYSKIFLVSFTCPFHSFTSFRLSHFIFLLKTKFGLSILSILRRKIGMISLIFSNLYLVHFMVRLGGSVG